MARLSSPEATNRWVNYALAEPMPPPDAAERTGAYRGPLKVRAVPQGVSGAQLAPERTAPAARQVWRRGRSQLVRILRVGRDWVTFLELTCGNSTRRMPRRRFERSSRLEAPR